MFVKKCKAIPKINFFLVDKLSEFVHSTISLDCRHFEILRFWSDGRARSQMDLMPGSQKFE